MEGLSPRSKSTLGPWSLLRPQTPRLHVIFSLDLDLPPGSPGRCTPKSSEPAPATLAGGPRRTAKKAESLSNSSRSESIHNSPKSCPTPEVSAGAGPGVWLCRGERGWGGDPGVGWPLARVGSQVEPGPGREGSVDSSWWAGSSGGAQPTLLQALPWGRPAPPFWGPERP